MSEAKRVEVFYSLQSNYCYFLLDRLLRLARADVEVVVRPVLGLVLRMPEATRERGDLEARYFVTDAERTAAYLGLPHAFPEPSPVQFEPGSLWVATEEQPRIERLHRLFVGAARAGKGLAFLDVVGRGLWDGSERAWDKTGFLHDAMSAIGLDHHVVISANQWDDVRAELDKNHQAMLAAGHWGAPLMVYEGEPFYGQDRFDQLVWRMGVALD